MHIVSVELSDIKRYESASYTFTLGTNAISGPNGSGKSTILEAIGYALFDTLPYKKEDFLRKGAKVGTVRVTFESSLDGRAYTVVRNTRASYYVYDPQTKTKLAEQKADVLAWLRLHLGVEPDTDLEELFRTAIGVPQGTFTAIFAETAVRRKAVFDRVLRVEEYRKSSDALKETAALLNAQVGEVDVKMAGFHGQLLRLPDLERQRDQLLVQGQDASRKLAGSRSELALWQSRLSEVDALFERLQAEEQALRVVKVQEEAARGDHAAKVARLAEARAAHEESLAVAPAHEAYQAAEADLKGLSVARATRDGLTERLHEAQRTQSVLAAERSARLLQIQALDAELAEFEQLKNGVVEQDRLEGERRVLEGEVREAAGLEAKLQRAKSELATRVAQLEALAAEIQQLEALRPEADRLQEREAALSAATKRVSELQEALLLTKEADQRLKLLHEGLAKDEAQLAETEGLIAKKEALRELAAQEPTIREEGQALSDQVSRLEGALERDRKAQSEFQGGNACPILLVGCPVLEGRSAAEFFAAQNAEREREIAERTRARDALRKRYVEAKAAEREVAGLVELERQRAALRQAIESARQQLQTLSAAQAEPLDAEALDAAHEEARKQEALLKQAQAAALRLEAHARLASQHASLADEIAARKSEESADRLRFEQLGAAPAKLEAVAKALAELGDPRARHAAIAKNLERRPQLERDALQAAEAEAALQERLEALEIELLPYADLDARWRSATAAKEAAESGYRRFLSLAVTAAELPAREADLAAAQAQLDRVSAEAERIHRALAATRLAYLQEDHPDLRARVEAHAAETIRLEQNVLFIEQQGAAVAHEIAELQRLQRELAQSLQERDRLAGLASFVEFARLTLKEAGPFITEAYLLNISLEADRLYRDITGSAHVHLRWSSDYEILLEENGRERPFASLSGGEQMAAALSVRLALLKEMSAIDLAFFDEPTTNMDESRRQNLAFSIGALKGFAQLVVISHDDTFEQWTDHVVRVGAATRVEALS